MPHATHLEGDIQEFRRGLFGPKLVGDSPARGPGTILDLGVHGSRFDGDGPAKYASRKSDIDIIAALPKNFPIILYAKGTPSQLTDQAFSGASVLGVDWTVDLGIVRKLVPGNVALQGNLDPVLMNTTPEIVRRETSRLLECMSSAKGHIFNLGHGIMPQAKLECVEALVDTVLDWKN